MGDILSLIEKAESVYEEAEAEVAAQKLMEGQFTFDDFLDQMAQIKKMGSISSLLGMMPGIPKEMKNVNIDDKELNRIEGMIHSMTRAERRSEEHTSELQSLMRISYAVFCLKKKKEQTNDTTHNQKLTK